MNLADVQPLEIHYHHGWVIWALFFVGQLLHAGLQINSLAASHKVTKKSVIESIWIPLAFRTFACAMVFLLIWEHPSLIAQIASLIGHPISPDEAAVFAIPVNNAIAGLYGLFLDSLLGYIPVLKSQLPALDTPGGNS